MGVAYISNDCRFPAKSQGLTGKLGKLTKILLIIPKIKLEKSLPKTYLCM